MSEAILKLFEGQDLSEDFKSKLTTIFSEAVDIAANEKVDALKESVTAEVTTALQEQFDAQIELKTKTLEEQTQLYIESEVLPEIDKYLTATVNEWKEENQIAIEAGAKVSLAESFLHGLVGLAESHNMALPQKDIVVEMQSKIDTMAESLQSLTDRNVTLMSENLNLVKQTVIAENTATLSESQKAKLQESLNKVDFKDQVQYATAVKSLVESTFPAEVKVDPIVENVQTPPVQQLTESDNYILSVLSKARSK